MAGVYISFPFCRQKCTYCNFASGVFADELRSRYLDALAEEMRDARFAVPPDTLYLGGGTPSLLSPGDLTSLLGALPSGGWREATIEVAPGDCSLELARAWREAGIDRVSLGVQSFDAAVARAAGRKHTAETVASEIDLLRAAGLERINVDLIAGLARQSRRTWAADLEWVEKLAIRHVSVYMLEADDESRLGAEIRAGGSRYGAALTPSDDEVAELYLEAIERLRGLGIERYEISNFAAPGQESLHNLKYWTDEAYIGFGADAHSFDGSTRWGNHRDAGEYVAASERGDSRRRFSETIDEGRRLEDRVMTGLRTRGGVALTGRELDSLEPALGDLTRRGWIERSDEGRIRFSDAGVLYSNEALELLLFG